MDTIDFGSISEEIKKDLSLREIENLNKLFGDVLIQNELDTSIRAKKQKEQKIYGIIFFSLIVLFMLIPVYLGSQFFIDIIPWVSGKTHNGSRIIGLMILMVILQIIGISLLIVDVSGKIIPSFLSAILEKIGLLIDPNLKYSSDEKFSFDDLQILGQGRLLKPYGTIESVRSSIFWDSTIENKTIHIQGFAIKTSQIQGSGKNKRKVITNNCYITKIYFPDIALPMGSDISILSDSINQSNMNKGTYILLMIFTCASIPLVVIGLILDSIPNFIYFISIGMAVILGAISYFFRINNFGSRRVIIDNNQDFEKKFDVGCSDSEFCKTILSQDFTQSLVNLIDETKHSYEFLIHDNIIYIKQYINDEYLSVTIESNLQKTMIHIIQFYIDIKELTSFIYAIGKLYSSQTYPEYIPKIRTNTIQYTPINFTKNKNMLLYKILNYIHL